MKALLTFAASLFCVFGVNAASPSFSSFYTNHFTTNNLIIKAKLNTNQFDTGTSSTNITITITNVSGVGGLLWTNDTSIGSSGRLMPIPGLDYAYVYPSNFYNHGWFTLQPEFHVLGSGTNTIGVEESSHLMFSMTNDPAEVIITLESGFAMGQELLLMSYTNTVFDGRFTLPADSVVSGGGLVKLNNNEDWLGANGSAIRLIWIEPDWWEQGRWTAGSNVTSDVIWENVNGLGVIQPRGGQITNALQFISGSSNASTNTLLTLDTVNVWVDQTTKLVQLRHTGTNVAYWTPYGSLEIGRNAAWGFPSSDDILLGVHDTSRGESAYSVIYAAAIDGNSETNYSEFIASLNTGASPAAVLTIAAITNTGVGSFNVLLQPDQNVARIELMNNGTNTFTVADDSHYSNPGVLFLSNDGTYKVGGSDGTNTAVMQLGPFTPLYLPVANGTNTLTDSPVHIPSTGSTNIIVDGRIYFAPGLTNFLAREGDINLIYEGPSIVGQSVNIGVRRGATTVFFGQTTAGGAIVQSPSNRAILDVGGVQAFWDGTNFAPDGSAKNLGTAANPWSSLYLTNQILFGPGITNVLYRDGNSLVVTNGSTTNAFSLVNGLGTKLNLTFLPGGSPVIDSSSGFIWMGDTTVYQGNLIPDAAATRSIGTMAAAGSFADTVIDGSHYVLGSNDSGANYTRLKLHHTGNAGNIQYVSDALGTQTFRPHVFMIGSTNVAKFDTTSAAGETRFWIYDEDNGTMERVTVGAPDSGGVGFKLLRIPN